jgi:hypothetical protein
MTINGKSKGNSFERKICREFSRFITGEEKKDIFWRSINSGGYSTTKNKKGEPSENHCGDMASIDPEGKLLINKCIFEFKHYKDINIWSILYPEMTGNNITGWWNIHLRRASDVNRHPILITRQNNKPVLFHCHSELGNLIINKLNINIRLIVPDLYMYIFFLSDVVQSDRKIFISIIKELKEWNRKQE